MVLADLGEKLTAAFSRMSKSIVINDKDIQELAGAISGALLAADVNVHEVKKLKDAIIQEAAHIPRGQNKQHAIKVIAIRELFKILGCNVNGSVEDNKEQENKDKDKNEDKKERVIEQKVWEPVKGKCNVVMFVGLQGAGKTTTCMKYAAYYKNKKNLKVAMICADTYRDGAYDQLKQNAIKIGVYYYGSYSETDPAVVVGNALERFSDDEFDLIIVDTSGRHKQSTQLFAEMEQITHIAKPDHTILVMDGSIGQAARDQAEAFKNRVSIGSVIITKLDGNAKGGGALSAVALTKAPISFIGTGEHMENIEPFRARSFVKRLLGMADIDNLVETLTDPDIMNKTNNTGLAKKLQTGTGTFTFRDMYEQMGIIMSMGDIGNLVSSFGVKLPDGVGAADAQNKFIRYSCVMQSMNAKELDSDDKIFKNCPSRLERIARGAGVSLTIVNDLLNTFKTFQPAIQTIMNRGGSDNGKNNKNNKNKNRRISNGSGTGGRTMANPLSALTNVLGSGGLGNIANMLSGGASSSRGRGRGTGTGNETGTLPDISSIFNSMGGISGIGNLMSSMGGNGIGRGTGTGTRAAEAGMPTNALQQMMQQMSGLVSNGNNSKPSSRSKRNKN